MTPSPKYALVALLHRAGPAGVWEHVLHRTLQPLFEPTALYGVREDLVGLSTIGWVHTVDERVHGRSLLRRYALADHIRPFVEYQLDLPALDAFLDGAPALAGSRA